jgi:nitrite reductase (NADH) small subunit
MTISALCRTADVPPDMPITVSWQGNDWAVAQHQGRYYALENTCPHRGGPLGRGSVQGGCLVCPWHAWTFDVTSGKCTFNPSVRVQSLPLRVDGDQLYSET